MGLPEVILGHAIAIDPTAAQAAYFRRDAFEKASIESNLKLL
jgi:hypothetical protein